MKKVTVNMFQHQLVAEWVDECDENYHQRSHTQNFSAI